MRNLILALVAFAAVSAQAALKLESEKAKPVFISGSGKQLSAIEAVQTSMKGDKVLKCTEVEASASDKGNISLKAKR